MSDVVKRLLDPAWRGPLQHLRSWSGLDQLHDDAAAEIARLRADLAAARADLAMAREREGATGLEYRGG